MSDYVIHTTPYGASILVDEYAVQSTLDEDYKGSGWACFYVWGEPHLDPDERQEYGVEGACRKHLVSDRIETLAEAEGMARLVVVRGYEAVISDADDWSQQPGDSPTRYDKIHTH